MNEKKLAGVWKSKYAFFRYLLLHYLQFWSLVFRVLRITFYLKFAIIPSYKGFYYKKNIKFHDVELILIELYGIGEILKAMTALNLLRNREIYRDQVWLILKHCWLKSPFKKYISLVNLNKDDIKSCFETTQLEQKTLCSFPNNNRSKENSIYIR